VDAENNAIRYKAIYFLDAAVNEKYQREKAKLIVEIYELEESFETFKKNNPDVPENNYQDSIDFAKGKLSKLKRVYDKTQEFLRVIDGPGLLQD
jgi:hypothetical protein